MTFLYFGIFGLSMGALSWSIAHRVERNLLVGMGVVGLVFAGLLVTPFGWSGALGVGVPWLGGVGMGVRRRSQADRILAQRQKAAGISAARVLATMTHMSGVLEWPRGTIVRLQQSHLLTLTPVNPTLGMLSFPPEMIREVGTATSADKTNPLEMNTITLRVAMPHGEAYAIKLGLEGSLDDINTLRSHLVRSSYRG